MAGKQISQFFFCVAQVPVSLWGLGAKLSSPKVAFMFATVRNRRQPFASVHVRRKALLMREYIWSGLESVSSGLVGPQLTAVIMAFAEEVSV